MVNLLLIGVYKLSASMIGYSPNVKSDIAVVTSRSTVVEFELEVNSVRTQEVVVKPEFFSGSNEERFVSNSSINNQEIRNTPGAPDVFRRLQFMAGVGRASESTSALIVRGGAPKENLTMI